MKASRRSDFLRAFAFGLFVLIGPGRSANAHVVLHAVLVEANPAADSAIAGPDIAIKLRFNVRIDRSRSRLMLALPDGKTVALKINEEGAPDMLSSRATGLGAGAYHLRWQVLAIDGHITRGGIPFNVKGSKG